MKRKVLTNKSTKTKSYKHHGKYFCTISVKWIAFFGLLALLAVGNLLYHEYTQPKVLGISTSLYRNCAFWDIICPIRNFFSDQDRLRLREDNKIMPTPGKLLLPTIPTLMPSQ